jgi:DNA mismatch repair protein MutS
MSAQVQIERVEKEVFERVKYEVLGRIADLRRLAYGLAHLDALLSFAYSASVYGYSCPRFDVGRDIIISEGRHPVVERSNGGFIPNDTLLNDHQSLWIITGPNMGGKSTYLRQVALIAVMAQCGSFVPAKDAQLPLLDRVFTRIGAGDNVAEGKSTFLVEMEETAVICSQATEKSLVILDEVGRGTSTFDGLAIAQAVVEYIYTQVRSRCLFATHYHELTDLQRAHEGIKSYYASSRKTNDGIIFLYKMTPGVADGSFGVEVAKLAELPTVVIMRAQELLQHLTLQDSGRTPRVQDASQASFDQILVNEYERLLQAHKELRAALEATQDQIRSYKRRLAPLEQLNYDHLSPKQAFDVVWSLKDEA